jgi:hypothetical protein
MHYPISRLALSGAAALTAVTLTVPTASATSTYDGHARNYGHTRVVVAKPVTKLLTGAGIKVAPTGAATARPYRHTVAASFPIRKIRDHKMVFLHRGGLRFSGGGASITTARFTVSLPKLRVTGRVSGSKLGQVGRVVLFTLHKTDRPRLGDAKLELTGTAAKAFNATFGVKAFSKGDTFGYATVSPR